MNWHYLFLIPVALFALLFLLGPFMPYEWQWGGKGKWRW